MAVSMASRAHVALRCKMQTPEGVSVMKAVLLIVASIVLGASVSSNSLAEDIAGAVEHPMIKRYPGQTIAWQNIHNYREYQVPVGAGSGYRALSEWIETHGRVTRTFYKYEGEDRSDSEVYENYLEALLEQDFTILSKGYAVDRKGVQVGSAKWMNIALRRNVLTATGEVLTLKAGTATSGGAGAIVARKERATGTVYVVIYVEQHSKDYIGTLIDIIEEQAVETGLVVIDAEAIGSDIDEYGRVVLDGLVFDFDEATLKDESQAALEAIATYLRDHPDQLFYVVGHTDAKGSYAYNRKLSSDRARTVVDTLVQTYDIAADRLEPHGVGPLVPVFSNGGEAGRERNRRVELVERQ